uniref:Uncharacterized protein n=1 Tax=Arundo donax TaxID=35708 RepID=A0A0A8Y2N1_ARUDO
MNSLIFEDRNYQLHLICMSPQADKLF